MNVMKNSTENNDKNSPVSNNDDFYSTGAKSTLDNKTRCSSEEKVIASLKRKYEDSEDYPAAKKQKILTPEVKTESVVTQRLPEMLKPFGGDGFNSVSKKHTEVKPEPNVTDQCLPENPVLFGNIAFLKNKFMSFWGSKTNPEYLGSKQTGNCRNGISQSPSTYSLGSSEILGFRKNNTHFLTTDVTCQPIAAVKTENNLYENQRSEVLSGDSNISVVKLNVEDDKQPRNADVELTDKQGEFKLSSVTEMGREHTDQGILFTKCTTEFEKDRNMDHAFKENAVFEENIKLEVSEEGQNLNPPVIPLGTSPSQLHQNISVVKLNVEDDKQPRNTDVELTDKQEELKLNSITEMGRENTNQGILFTKCTAEFEKDGNMDLAFKENVVFEETIKMEVSEEGQNLNPPVIPLGTSPSQLHQNISSPELMETTGTQFVTEQDAKECLDPPPPSLMNQNDQRSKRNKRSSAVPKAIDFDPDCIIQELIIEYKELIKLREFAIQDIVDFIIDRIPSVPYLKAVHEVRLFFLNNLKSGTLVHNNGKYRVACSDSDAFSTENVENPASSTRRSRVKRRSDKTTKNRQIAKPGDEMDECVSILSDISPAVASDRFKDTSGILTEPLISVNNGLKEPEDVHPKVPELVTFSKMEEI